MAKLFLVMLTACNKDNSDELNSTLHEIPSITLPTNIISNGVTLTSQAGDYSMSFYSNTNWTLSITETQNDASWCTPSATSGSKGNANIKFRVTENTEHKDRYVTVTIKANTACVTFKITQEQALMFYEPENGVHFLNKEQSHSFLSNLEQDEAEMTIPVMMVGNTKNKDLKFSYKIINDEKSGFITTAKEGQYQITETIIPKGKSSGWIKLHVKNPHKLNISEKTLTISLELIDNEEVKAGGWRDYLRIKLIWGSDVVKPYSWNSMKYFLCLKYSSNVYRAYIEATGLTEMYYSLTPAPDGSYWTQNKCIELGKKFGDWVDNYNKTHNDAYRHDDGDYAGELIIPLY